MISWGWILLTFSVALWIGLQVGHRWANLENAEECRRLGGFFVGSSVFKCTEIIDPRPRSGYPGAPPPLRESTVENE